MAKLTVKCDKCGVELIAADAEYDYSEEYDLCKSCLLNVKLDRAKYKLAENNRYYENNIKPLEVEIAKLEAEILNKK